MKIVPKSPTVKNPPERFSGDVWLDNVASPKSDEDRLGVARVRFAPGAHTAWHSHARGQTLHIESGVALIGTRDGTVIRATAGQSIYTPPGEEHWHGATPEDFMEHLAIAENSDDPARSMTWLEHVAPEEYERAATQR